MSGWKRVQRVDRHCFPVVFGGIARHHEVAAPSQSLDRPPEQLVYSKSARKIFLRVLDFSQPNMPSNVHKR